MQQRSGEQQQVGVERPHVIETTSQVLEFSEVQSTVMSAHRAGDPGLQGEGHQDEPDDSAFARQENLHISTEFQMIHT